MCGIAGLHNLNDEPVANGIENLVSDLAVDDDVFRAEHGEVLGGVRLLDPEPLDERAGGEFAVPKLLDDGDSRGMRKSLEEVGFKLAQHILHENILFIEYTIIVARLGPSEGGKGKASHASRQFAKNAKKGLEVVRSRRRFK